MTVKNLLKPSNHTKLALVLALLVGVVAISWWQYNRHLQAQELKLNAERQRASSVLRASGIAAAKIQRSQNKQILQEDVLAPHELSDEAELAQAKLWHSLPKDKRLIMQAETINAGLAATANQ